MSSYVASIMDIYLVSMLNNEYIIDILESVFDLCNFFVLPDNLYILVCSTEKYIF